MIHMYRVVIGIALSALTAHAQTVDATKPDGTTPKQISGMSLVWNDEFNTDGKPSASNWKYETGFVRNQELQWYQSDNASVKGGVLILEGRKQQVTNPKYVSGSTDWKLSRQYAQYTSASVNTSGLRTFKFGKFETRARINTQKGSWPAIWTLGTAGEWPSNGEIDILEFYQIGGVPSILANFAWGTSTRWVAKWDGANKPLSYFTGKDSKWADKFHVWTMDWNADTIRLLLDGELMNETLVKSTLNPDGSNPFLQSHYILLNLALGANGGDPSGSTFPMLYEVDYVRVYQKSTDIVSPVQKQQITKQFTYSVAGKNLTITSQNAKVNSTVSIYNMAGALVKQAFLGTSASNNQYTISLHNMASGTYFVRTGNDHSPLESLIVR